MPTVVVGYDASPAAHAAVDHAVHRAGPDGKVIVVHSYKVPDDWLGSPYFDQLLDKALGRAEDEIKDLERDCPSLASIDYESDVLPGTPGEAICRVAKHRRADEIVIGTRGLGRVHALLGSVAHDVLHLAHCPVTVIPDRAVTAEPETTATA